MDMLHDITNTRISISSRICERISISCRIFLISGNKITNLALNRENQEDMDMLHDITNNRQNLCCYKAYLSLVSLVTDMLCNSTRFDSYWLYHVTYPYPPLSSLLRLIVISAN